MTFRPRRWAIVCCLVAAAALEGAGAFARDMPAGTKNFIPPTAVPNYFSNEREPFLGRSGSPPREPGGVPVAAAPRERPPTRHVAGRHVAGRRGHHHRTLAHAAHARSRSHVAVRHRHSAVHSARSRRPAAHVVRPHRGAVYHPSGHHPSGDRLVHRQAPHREVRPVAQR